MHCTALTALSNIMGIGLEVGPSTQESISMTSFQLIYLTCAYAVRVIHLRAEERRAECLTSLVVPFDFYCILHSIPICQSLSVTDTALKGEQRISVRPVQHDDLRSPPFHFFHFLSCPPYTSRVGWGQGNPTGYPHPLALLFLLN